MVVFWDEFEGAKLGLDDLCWESGGDRLGGCVSEEEYLVW